MRGMLRLWTFGSSLWLGAVAIACVHYVYVEEACYKFLTVSKSDSASLDDSELAKSMERKATSGVRCGARDRGLLLNLESLAERKAVTQVAISWFEPDGWSDEVGANIDVFDGKEITVSEIERRAADNVRESRIANKWQYAVAAALIPMLLLGIGAGIRWVYLGFRM